MMVESISGVLLGIWVFLRGFHGSPLKAHRVAPSRAFPGCTGARNVCTWPDTIDLFNECVSIFRYFARACGSGNRRCTRGQDCVQMCEMSSTRRVWLGGKKGHRVHGVVLFPWLSSKPIW